MRKICEKCGREFEAKQSHFRLCSSCFSSRQRINISSLLLETYYDDKNNLLKEIFIGLPEKLAKIFHKDKLTITQLINFYQKIQRACNNALLHGIDIAKPIIYECHRDLEYQLKRGLIPRSFFKFMKHHLEIAEKNEKELEGFRQHLESILAYFPK